MVLDEKIGKHNRMRGVAVVIGGIAAAALLIGAVMFTTTTTAGITATSSNNINNNSMAAYAQSDERQSGEIKTPSGNTIVRDIKKPQNREIGDQPPFLVPFSEAAKTVEKEFPDSNIASGERQYVTIKNKSHPGSFPHRETGGTDNSSTDQNQLTMTPAYIFQLTKTDDKALYQMTVVVNATSGQIIPPKDIEEILLQPGIGIPYNPMECHYNPKWGTWHGPGCFWLHPPMD